MLTASPLLRPRSLNTTNFIPSRRRSRHLKVRPTTRCVLVRVPFRHNLANNVSLIFSPPPFSLDPQLIAIVGVERSKHGGTLHVDLSWNMSLIRFSDSRSRRSSLSSITRPTSTLSAMSHTPSSQSTPLWTLSLRSGDPNPKPSNMLTSGPD